MSQVRLPAAAVEALARGRVIEAVKLVRAASGLGLKEAHDLVQAFQAQTRGRPAPPAPPPQSGGARTPGGFVFPQQATDALARGDVIQAIAALRGANPNLDLRTAKDAIDQMRGQKVANAASASTGSERLRARVPTVVEGDRGGFAGLLVALALALVAIAWWWSRG